MDSFRLLRQVSAVLLLLLCAASAHGQSFVWPGQSGNNVGFAAAPGWPGSFTATACGAATSGSSWATATVISNCTYSTSSHTSVTCNFCIFEYVDFKSTATADNNVQIATSGQHVMFIGCRFQSNYLGGANVSSFNSPAQVVFLYDSFTPLVSFYNSPPGAGCNNSTPGNINCTNWPSGGAGANSTSFIEETGFTPGTFTPSNANAINGNKGYEIALYTNSGAIAPITMDSCDLWGFADAIQIGSGNTTQQIYTNNWLHDIVNPSEQVYHTDGIGYLNGAGGNGPSNVLIQGNAIGSLGNTNIIAMQASGGGYSAVNVAENFLSGDNATIAWCRSTTCINSYFYGNVFGTNVEDFGVIDTGASVGTGSMWGCNTISFLTGTTWTNNDGWKPLVGMNGQFLLDATFPNSATDQGGNTVCAITTPASYNFGFQGVGGSSASQTVTLYNKNTATLTGITPVMATGTNFSIVSNGCGSTLAAGSNCAITVKFAPTALGPSTDTLKITDNTPGVTSPQLIPLLGVGTAGGSTVVTPTFSPAGGTYTGTQTVTVSTTTGGATLCGTTDGSVPTEVGNACSGGTTFTITGPITVSSSKTLRALGTLSGFTDSSVASATYVINPPTVATPSALQVLVQ